MSPLYEPGGSGGISPTEFTAKGDILVGTGSGTFDNLPVATDGWYLKLNSATATGLEWAAVSATATQVDRASGAAGDYVAREKLTADTQYRLVAELRSSTSEPELLFGPGSTTAPDVRVARTATKTLTLDDGAGGAATLAFSSTGAALWGGDVRAYRSGTKYLTVDDGAAGAVTVNIVGSLLVNGSAPGGATSFVGIEKWGVD